MRLLTDLLKIIFVLLFILGWLFVVCLPFIAAGTVAYIAYHFVVKYW